MCSDTCCCFAGYDCTSLTPIAGTPTCSPPVSQCAARLNMTSFNPSGAVRLPDRCCLVLHATLTVPPQTAHSNLTGGVTCDTHRHNCLPSLML